MPCANGATFGGNAWLFKYKDWCYAEFGGTRIETDRDEHIGEYNWKSCIFRGQYCFSSIQN